MLTDEIIIERREKMMERMREKVRGGFYHVIKLSQLASAKEWNGYVNECAAKVNLFGNFKYVGIGSHNWVQHRMERVCCNIISTPSMNWAFSGSHKKASVKRLERKRKKRVVETQEVHFTAIFHELCHL